MVEYGLAADDSYIVAHDLFAYLKLVVENTRLLHM
jgi:hypothetical protein